MGSLLDRVISVSAGGSIPRRESHPASLRRVPDQNRRLSTRKQNYLKSGGVSRLRASRFDRLSSCVSEWLFRQRHSSRAPSSCTTNVCRGLLEKAVQSLAKSSVSRDVSDLPDLPVSANILARDRFRWRRITVKSKIALSQRIAHAPSRFAAIQETIVGEAAGGVVRQARRSSQGARSWGRGR